MKARGEDTPFAPDIEFHRIEAGLEAPDPVLAERLQGISTMLELPAIDVGPATPPCP